MFRKTSNNHKVVLLQSMRPQRLTTLTCACCRGLHMGRSDPESLSWLSVQKIVRTVPFESHKVLKWGGTRAC